MKKYLYVGIFFLFLGISLLQGQSGSLLLYNMERVPQSNQMNPAKFPVNTKWYLSLPSIDISLSSPIAYRDVIERRNNDSLYFTLGKTLAKLRDKNKLRFDLNVQTSGFGFCFNKFYFTISMNERSSVSLMIPKDFFDFIVNGNTKYRGESAYLLQEGFGEAVVWNELAFGAGYKINDHWSVAVKPKLLFGIANVHTGKSYLSMYTSETGDMLRADCLIDIHTSLPSDVASFMKNGGFSIDIGGIYRINDRFEVSASVVDLGFISWGRDNNTQYRTRNGAGSFEFYGFDWNDLWGEEEGFNEGFLNTIVDTLQTMMEIDTLSHVSRYTTMLPVRMFLSGSYRINDMFKVNALYRLQFMDRKTYSTFSINANYYSGKWFEVSIGNSIIDRSFFNPGVAMNLSFGGVFQFFGTADFSSINVATMKTFNFHFGMNVLLGYREKSMPPERDTDI